MSWNVYLKGKLIDRVWFTNNCNAQYVRDSLVNHDGYDCRITVTKGADHGS